MEMEEVRNNVVWKMRSYSSQLHLVSLLAINRALSGKRTSSIIPIKEVISSQHAQFMG